MGQRLNLEIKNNKEVLANCYFHWSGFSSSSLNLTKQVIEYVSTHEVSADVKGAIEVLEGIGASFNRFAFDEAVKLGVISGTFEKYSLKRGVDIDRNNGLIAIDKKGMKETEDWEEGRVSINIEDKTFYFKCYSENDYNDDEEIWERIKDLFLPITIKDRIWNISFDEIDYLIEQIDIAEDQYRGRFIINDLWCGYSIY